MHANTLGVDRTDSRRRPVDATDVILTGDRSTDALHLGHFAGSLRSRRAIQGRCHQTLLVADLHGL